MKTKMKTTTIKELKETIIDFCDIKVYATKYNNTASFDSLDDLYYEKIEPYIPNENIETWEKDIKSKFIDPVHLRFKISEKQAYCLARAFSKINPKTILN